MSRSKKCICGEINPDNFYYGYSTKCKKCKIQESKDIQTHNYNYKTKKDKLILNLENNLSRYSLELNKLSDDKILVQKISDFIVNIIVEETIYQTFSEK
jgi:hypothetical protein